VKYLRHQMTPQSLLRYGAWRLGGSRSSVRIRLRSGPRIELRPAPFNDLFGAHEIFVRDVYRCPDPNALSSVNSIVDIGANIGLSCIYWAYNFKNAKILAFEPHPRHIEIVKRNARLNHLENRLTLIEAAAGPEAGEAVLSDASLCSSLIGGSDDKSGIRVPIVDVFKILENRTIDLLKIDVEGYEYAILQDKRLSSLSASVVVMEWHNTPDVPDGRAWCSARLTEVGYRVVGGNDEQATTGVLWAFRH
jgi:FkbM family methyltransferase